MDEDINNSDTAPTYKENDVVWVKLGSQWWPGEVKEPDSLPKDVVDFKRPPLAIVKFFDEDAYEYVRSWSHIYPYNCDRKNEFIKKGMAAFRSKQSLMGKFPVDVSCAEVKSGGNASILSDPMFLPEKKVNYVAEVFKTPTPKKVQKDTEERRGRKKGGKNKSGFSAADSFQVTHRRFLGFDDYKAYICVQYIGKDKEPNQEDEEIRNLNSESKDLFHCHTCTFVTRSTELMVLHCKSHIQGVYVPSKKPAKPTTSSLDSASGSGSERTPVKRKRTTPKKKSSIVTISNVVKQKKGKSPVLDIRSDLLAEWDDSEEDNEEIVSSLKDTEDNIEEIESETDEPVEKIVKNDASPETVEEKVEPAVTKSKPVKKIEKAKKSTQEDIKSCFDFDDEDDVQEEIIAAPSTGRKIPRVIPEKRKSPMEVDEDKEINRDEILKESETLHNSIRNLNEDNVDAAFKDLMESTAVPELPEITPNTLKPEQNFHDGNTVKFPDKLETDTGDVAKSQEEKSGTEGDNAVKSPARPKAEQSTEKHKAEAVNVKSPEKLRTRRGNVVRSEKLKTRSSNVVRYLEKTGTRGGNAVKSPEKPETEVDNAVKSPEKPEAEEGNDVKLPEKPETEIGYAVNSPPGRLEAENTSAVKSSEVEFGDALKSPEQPEVEAGNAVKSPEKPEVEAGNAVKSPPGQLEAEDGSIVKSSEMPGDAFKSPEKPELEAGTGNAVKSPDTSEAEAGIAVKSPEKSEAGSGNAVKSEAGSGSAVKSPDTSEAEAGIAVKSPEKSEEGSGNAVKSEAGSGSAVKSPDTSEAGSGSAAVKSPDTSEAGSGNAVSAKSSPHATRLTSPKKRFVKSFEDFQLEMNRKGGVEKMLGIEEKFPESDESGAEILESEAKFLINDKKALENDVTNKVEDLSGEIVVVAKQHHQEIRCKIALAPDEKEKIIRNSIESREKETEKERVEEPVPESTEPPKNLEKLPVKPGRSRKQPKKEDTFKFGQRWSSRNIKPHKTMPVTDVKEDKKEETHLKEDEKVEKEILDDISSIKIPEPVEENQKKPEEEPVLEPVAKKKRGRPRKGSKHVEERHVSEETAVPSLKNEVAERSQVEAPLESVTTEMTEVVDAKVEENTVVVQSDGVSDKSQSVEEKNISLEFVGEKTPGIEEPQARLPDIKTIKGQISSKLAEDALTVTDQSKLKKAGRHKSAKSKILESYRQKQVEEGPDTNVKPLQRSVVEEKCFENKEKPEISFETFHSEKSTFDFSLNDSNAAMRMTVQNIIDNILPDDEETIEPTKPSEEVILPPKKNIHRMDDYKSTKSRLTLLPKKERRKTVEERGMSPDLFEDDQEAEDKVKLPKEDENVMPGFHVGVKEDTVESAAKKDEKEVELKEKATNLNETHKDEVFNLGEMLAKNKDSFPIEESLLHPEEKIKDTHETDENTQRTDENTQKTDENTQRTDENAQKTDETTKQTEENSQKTEETTQKTDENTQKTDVNVLQRTESVEDIEGYSKNDDFSAIGNASFELPEDAICSPPKKVSKRKSSEGLSQQKSEDTTVLKTEQPLYTPSKRTSQRKFSGELSQQKSEEKPVTPPKRVSKRKISEELSPQHKAEQKPVETTYSPSKKISKRKISEDLTQQKTEENIVLETTTSKRVSKRKISTELSHHKLEDGTVLKQENEDVVISKTVGKRKRKSTSISDIKVEETIISKEEQIEIEEIPLESEEIIEETVVLSENIIEDHKNEVEVGDTDEFKFSIQTNLTNFSKAEEISAVALATLSEIQAEKKQEKSHIVEEKMSPVINFPAPAESELVQVEGNVTVMSEKDLGDSQVEITSDKIISTKKKPVTLATFSMDFEHQKVPKPIKNNGTEFSSRAMTNRLEKIHNDKSKAYERMELLDILEGNSNSSGSEQKFKESFDAYDKKDIVQGICDFEECIPQQIVVAKPKEEQIESPVKEPPKPTKAALKRSKLMERLTEPKSSPEKVANLTQTVNKMAAPALLNKPPVKFYTKTTKNPATLTNKANSKPVILSEQIIKTTIAKSPVASPQKEPFEDVEDVEAFVIPKTTKKDEDNASKKSSSASKAAGKAKILHQTIITAEGEIIQPSDGTAATAPTDFNVFDINSMPIVLSDQILTPESIENMPIMLEGDQKVITPVVPAVVPKKVVTTTVSNVGQKIGTTVNSRTPTTAPIKATKPRILQSNTKIKANSPLLPTAAKSAKYIIVPSKPTTNIPQGKVLVSANASPATPTGSKQVVAPTKTIVRKAGGSMVASKMHTVPASPADDMTAGNKIMIFTTQQGQQHRLLLTPAQQKMLGYQTATTQPSKIVTKTIVKSGVIPKSLINLEGSPGPSGVSTKSPLVQQRVTTVAQSAVTQSGLLMPASQQVKTPKTVYKRAGAAAQRSATAQKPQKTILIKNQHGQTVRKIQGTDDAELDKQVAEQIEAIKASARLSQVKQPDVITYKPNQTPKAPTRRSAPKKAEAVAKKQTPAASTVKFNVDSPVPVPALTPLPSSKKSVDVSPTDTGIHRQQHQLATTQVVPATPNANSTSVSTKQLVIQDALGNQTTVAVGQILALPSETVDGQPQSYMLVTLDESGNLTPLNNEALMSLDPSLGMNFDMNNIMLELDQNKATPNVTEPASVAKITTPSEIEKKTAILRTTPPPPPPPVVTAAVETVTKTPGTVVNTESGGQQLIVTGDPIATQKFLESLSEGTTDLANILANAEGSSILIQADGQQILINTNSDNQMLLNVADSTEGGGNPIFATQPSKSQDILAAALADTDVFQQEQSHTAQKLASQLSPNSALYPMNVGNVLETSLTLSSPIMTPLEVPSNNSKKIDDSADILSQVPKNVDLPITITDPNIAHTVAQQHVANMMANELPTMELQLPISASSTEMSSPSFVYSLPNLDDISCPNSSGSGGKSFGSSMPLLTEDQEDEVGIKSSLKASSPSTSTTPQQQSFMDDQEEGLCTLGGQICSSLSEPPPDMFDLPDVDGPPPPLSHRKQHPDGGDEEISSDMSSAQVETSSVNSEGSCEIPIQPDIRVSLSDLDPRPRCTEEENGPSGAENHDKTVD